MKRIALIGLLLVIALSSVGNAKALVLAEGNSAPALDPGDPIAPTGIVISNVPLFQWSAVGGATNYHIKVKKGSKTVYSFKSTITTHWIPSILSNRDFKWKVRAKVGGNWQSWSAWEHFTINASGGFKSSFNNNANGWTKLNGKWKIAKGRYVTSGKENLHASSMYSADYSNFTYEVRMRRVWDGACWKGWDNSIYLRGDPSPLTGIKEWHDGMRFYYSHRGNYSIVKTVAGVRFALENEQPAPINKKGWNTLLIVAKGSTYYLYINGEFIRSKTDISQTIGVVGLSFYQGGSCNDKLQVDWAKLSTNTPW